jgi:hypothetical protein
MFAWNVSNSRPIDGWPTASQNLAPSAAVFRKYVSKRFSGSIPISTPASLATGASACQLSTAYFHSSAVRRTPVR